MYNQLTYLEGLVASSCLLVVWVGPSRIRGQDLFNLFPGSRTTNPNQQLPFQVFRKFETTKWIKNAWPIYICPNSPMLRIGFIRLIIHYECQTRLFIVAFVGLWAWFPTYKPSNLNHHLWWLCSVGQASPNVFPSIARSAPAPSKRSRS